MLPRHKPRTGLQQTRCRDGPRTHRYPESAAAPQGSQVCNRPDTSQPDAAPRMGHKAGHVPTARVGMSRTAKHGQRTNACPRSGFARPGAQPEPGTYRSSSMPKPTPSPRKPEMPKFARVGGSGIGFCSSVLCECELLPQEAWPTRAAVGLFLRL